MDGWLRRKGERLVSLPAAARVDLLDGFAVAPADGQPSCDPDRLPRSAQRLVAHLSLSIRPDRRATAGQLWPDVTEDQAQSSLRSALWRLQKSLPGLVEASAGALRLAPGVAVDVRELTGWAYRVLDPQVEIDQIRTPETALRGELLPGWYEDWVLLERERLRQLRMHALEVLADKLVCVGRFGEAVQAAMAAVAAEPLRESARRAVVRVHLAEGNLAEAVREYESFRELLADELGVLPSPQLECLMRGIRLPHRRA
jgi:DNA-binding SARP family transcriptional activator